MLNCDICWSSSCYLVVSFGNYRGRSLVSDGESVVEHVTHSQLARLRVDHLGRDSGLDVVVFRVHDLRVEVEERPNLHWSPEPNIVHMQTKRPSLADKYEIKMLKQLYWTLLLSPESVCVRPGQLKGLSHDKTSKYLVEPVPVLRLTYDEIF